MNDNQKVVVLVVVGAAFFIGAALGSYLTVNKVHRSAIAAGVGTYITNKEGYVVFHWLPPFRSSTLPDSDE